MSDCDLQQTLQYRASCSLNDMHCSKEQTKASHQRKTKHLTPRCLRKRRSCRLKQVQCWKFVSGCRPNTNASGSHQDCAGL
ncbi:hypothetical protein WJX84_007395 [Apatococcus fuscideae]|uniref:Uncharacterized protein n=1 Tax=Apatococcus fuscideae TaxID=2026836 RepID=A0AAW1T7Y3_9CHLO